MDRIITIGREFGSGGRTIGKIVASKLNVPYYDREIIDESAEQLGFNADFIAEHEQKASGKFMYNLGMSLSYGYGTRALPLTDQIYCAQAKVIKELAAKGPCVIVGRCADHVLKNSDKLLRVFIYSDMEHRQERAVNFYGMKASTAKKEIQRSDKARARHYSLFTDRTWGDRENYDLLLDSGFIGIEECAEIICRIANKTEE